MGELAQKPKGQEINNNSEVGTTKVIHLHSAKVVKKAGHLLEIVNCMMQEAQHFLSWER